MTTVTRVIPQNLLHKVDAHLLLVTLCVVNKPPANLTDLEESTQSSAVLGVPEPVPPGPSLTEPVIGVSLQTFYLFKGMFEKYNLNQLSISIILAWLEKKYRRRKNCINR